MCLLEILNTHLNSLQRTNLRDIEQLVQQSIPNDHVVHRRLWTDTLLEFVRNADRFPSYEELASYVQETNEQTKLDLNDSIIVQILWLLNYCVDLPIHPQCLQSYVEQDDWKRILLHVYDSGIYDGIFLKLNPGCQHTFHYCMHRLLNMYFKFKSCVICL